MAQVALLLSSLIGLLLIGAIAALIGRGSRGYSLPRRVTSGDEGPSLLGRIARSPAVWTLTFVVAALGLAGAALAVAGVVALPDGTKAAAGVALAAGTGLLLAFYLFYGTFASARARGLGNSQAAMIGSWVIGLLFVVVIALKLLGLV
ncbi:MAG: hypothetical protein ABEH40_03785 [Haloferacaceae archaeon]